MGVLRAHREQAAAPPDGSLYLRYLDVGQGDATLLTTSSGENLLIDTGTDDGADHMVGEIARCGVGKIDVLVLTHNHEDHIGGADEVFDAFDVDAVYFCGPSDADDSATADRAYDAAAAEDGCAVHYTDDLKAGMTSFGFGGATVTVIASPLYPSDNENNNSTAVRIDYGSTAFLFTGDAEREEEEALLDRYGASLFDANVLQLGHHGSSTSSCDRFLDAVRPGTAVISCGAGNSYGHPHGETLDALEERGITVLRTDEVGTVTLSSDGEKVMYHEE